MRYLLYLILLIFTMPIMAKESNDKELKSAVKSFDELQKQINRMSLKKNNCDPVGQLILNDHCTLESLCSELNSKSLNLFFYKDNKNRAIINHQLYSFFSTINKCLNRNLSLKKKLQEKGDSPFWEMHESLDKNIYFSYHHFNKKRVEKVQYQKNIVILNDRLKEVDAIFEEARIEVVQFLSSKLPNKKIEEYIKKVNQLEFYPNPFCDLNEKKIQFNLYYLPWIHSLRVCLPMLSFPDLELKKFLLHEIGHIFDPLTESLKLKPSEIVIRNEDEEMYNSDLYRPTFKRKKALSVNLSEIPNKMDKNYPFENVLHCMKNEKNLGKNEGDFFKAGENFSDWLSTTLISKSNFYNVEAKELRYVLPGFFLAQSCTTLSDKIIDELRRFMQITNCGKLPKNLTIGYGTFLGELKQATDPHASVKSRIDKIIFAHPKIREKLGCPQEKESHFCE